MPRTHPESRPQPAADLLVALGGIPAWRVVLKPPPGTATKRHLIYARGPHGGTCELIDRTIVEKPPNSLKAYLTGELGFRLYDGFDEELGYGCSQGAWFEVAPGTIRCADVSIFRWPNPKRKLVPRAQVGEDAPLLAVDILTADNTRGEMARKLKEYFGAGTRLVWVIDPRKGTAAAYTAPDVKRDVPADGTLDGGDILPGFSLPLAALFERLEEPAAKKRKK